MDYKEKMIELLNRKELSKEEEEKLADIFPELKEIEDERIRKDIISYIQLANQFIPQFHIDRWIAWLEKQGEQANYNPYKATIESIAATFERYDDNGDLKDFYDNIKVKCKDAIEYDNTWTKKQGDLKSDKWKEGDVVKYGGVFALVTNGRKAILSNCEQITIQYPDEWVKVNSTERKHFFDVLEKQCEQKSKTLYLWKHWKDGIAGNGDGNFAFLIKNDDTYSLSSCLSYECDYIELDDLNKLLPNEKQGNTPEEVTYVHEVETGNGNIKALVSGKVKLPKFKVGDWVVTKDGKVNQVKAVSDDGYAYTLDDGTYFSGSWKDIYHLWTIQDAKDGDVLAWDGSKCIALFKNIYDKDSFNSYGFVGHCTGTFETRLSYHDIEGAHPATKEQRDLLLQKIKEAGYEWDADKKELKKIEQKSVDRVKPKFRVGDTMRTRQEASNGITDGLPVVVSIDGEYYHCNNELIAIKDQDDYEYPPMNIKQNPAWSEEDDNILATIIKEGDLKPSEIQWLKSLKDRVGCEVNCTTTKKWKPRSYKM